MIQGKVSSIKVHVECGGCGLPFVVSMDPSRTPPSGWSTFDLAVDAVRGSDWEWHPAAKRKDHDGSTSVQGSHILCPDCTGVVDATDAETEEEVKAVLDREAAKRTEELHGAA